MFEVARKFSPKTEVDFAVEELRGELIGYGFTNSQPGDGELLAMTGPKFENDSDLITWAPRVVLRVSESGELELCTALTKEDRWRSWRYPVLWIIFVGLFAILTIGMAFTPKPWLMLYGLPFGLSAYFCGPLIDRFRGLFIKEAFGILIGKLGTHREPRPVRRVATQRCSYCHEDFEGRLAMVCLACDARFHADCREEFGGCSSLGCAGSEPRESALGKEEREDPPMNNSMRNLPRSRGL